MNNNIRLQKDKSTSSAQHTSSESEQKFDSMFYNLEDEPDVTNNMDSSEKNEHPSSTEPNNKSLEVKPEPFAMMLRIMINPNNGWRAYKQLRFSTSAVEYRCFYPLIVLAALATFFTKFYSPNTPYSQLIVDAIIIFMSFFFGYFIVLVLCRYFVPKASKEKMLSTFGKNYLLLGLSLEALFSIFQSILQFIEPVVVFLPLYTIYLMSKGVKFLRVPKDSENVTAGIGVLLVVGVPMLLEWLFEIILPSSI